MGLYAERNYRLTLTDFDRYGRLHPASVLGLLQENSSKVAAFLGTLERRDLSVDCDEGSYPLSLSIGYVESYQVADLQQAMSKADAALYAVKLAGKAGFRKYTDEMDKELDERVNRLLNDE